MCFAEKGQVSIIYIYIVFGLIRAGIEPTIYRVRVEHANHYTNGVAHDNHVMDTEIVKNRSQPHR